MHIKADAVAGAVVHLRSAIWSLIAGARGAVAAVDQDLAHGVMHVSSGDASADRFDTCIQRLQHCGVHARDLLGNLAHHHGASEVAVMVARPAHREDIDDHRRAGTDLAFAAVVRHGVLRGPGDDHVRARVAHLAESERGARAKPFGGHRAAVGPQQPVPNLSAGQQARDLGHRCFRGLLRLADVARLLG